jgi:CheY-like chemotaxis protein
VAEYCEDTGGTAITRAIQRNVPDIAVIDLSRLPSHGREIAVWLRGRKATRHIPLIFVDGEPEKVLRIRELLPDAVFTDLAGLPKALKRAKSVSSPVVPPQMMDRFQGRTAAEKLGIRAGSTAGVVDAPRDYLTVLGAMPEGVECTEDPAAPCGVTLWFIHDPEPFLEALSRMRAIASRTKLWVLWRKGSQNGITQNFVRETAIGAGLVDYKICSVDGRWSAIAFARKKQ